MSKFKLDQRVYFLKNLENCCLNICSNISKEEIPKFSEHHGHGNVEEIHINKDGVFYDIRTFNINNYPLELIKMISEEYVSSSELELSLNFKQTIYRNIEFIKDCMRC